MNKERNRGNGENKDNEGLDSEISPNFRRKQQKTRLSFRSFHPNKGKRTVRTGKEILTTFMEEYNNKVPGKIEILCKSTKIRKSITLKT